MAAKNKETEGGITTREEIVVFSTFLRFSPLKLSICIGRKSKKEKEKQREREKERAESLKIEEPISFSPRSLLFTN